MSYANDVSSTNWDKSRSLETDDPESSDYIQRDINVLSYASKAPLSILQEMVKKELLKMMLLEILH